MADSKISALTELTAPAADDELIIVDKSDTSMAASGTDKRIVYGTFGAAMGSITTIQPNDAAAAGTALAFARGDHKHAIATAAVLGMYAMGSASAEGTSTSFARADHEHGNATFANAIAVPPGFQLLGTPTSTATGATNTYYALPFMLWGTTTVTGVEVRNGATVNGTLRSALYNAVFIRVADRTTGANQANTGARQRVAFDSTYLANPGLYFALIWASSATATFLQAEVLGTRVSTGTNATTTPTTPASLAAGTTAPVLSLY